MEAKEFMKMMMEQDDRSKRIVSEFVRLHGAKTVTCTGADDYGCSLRVDNTDMFIYVNFGDIIETDTGKTVADVANRISARSVRKYTA